MIILHRGTGFDNNIHFGYVYKENSDYYIINNKGIKHKVREDTICPVFDPDWASGHEAILKKLPVRLEPTQLHKIEDYLCDVSPSLPARFKSRGVNYLEELETWTDADILNIRTIGKNKLERIREILLKYEITNVERKN